MPLNLVERPARALRWVPPWIVGIVVASTSIAACNEGPTSPSSSDAADGALEAGLEDTSSAADRDRDVSTEDASTVEARCVLTPSVSDPVVRAGSAVQLGAYQHLILSGDPMPDERLTFQIVSEEPGAGRFSSESVRTNHDGLGAVRFSASGREGPVLVRVASDCASSIDIGVEIVPTDPGE